MFVTIGASVSSVTVMPGALGIRFITRTRVRMGSAPTPLPESQATSATPHRQSKTQRTRRKIIEVPVAEGCCVGRLGPPTGPAGTGRRAGDPTRGLYLSRSVTGNRDGGKLTTTSDLLQELTRLGWQCVAWNECVAWDERQRIPELPCDAPTIAAERT